MKKFRLIFVLVKKLLVIFFLTIYMVSTTELSELLKLPILIEHYIEHKETSPEMSLFKFLTIHYNDHSENHPKNHDYEQDQKLPFIAHSQTLSFCFIYPQPFYVEFKTFIKTKEISKIMPVNDNYLDNNYQTFIWQPPKFS